MNEAPPLTRWANIHLNKDFLYMESRSGYRRNLYDIDGFHIYLEPDAPVPIVGASLIRALNQSRFLDPYADHDLFTWQVIEANENAWIKETMSRYGYKTKKRMFDHLAFVHVSQSEGRVTFEPRRWAKTAHWWDLPEDQNVVIPVTDDEQIVGEAARLALSRCT
jgi:hypothetical protein